MKIAVIGSTMMDIVTSIWTPSSSCVYGYHAAGW